MKILSLSMLVLMSLNINSCKSKKEVSENETKVEIKVEIKEEMKKTNFIEEGYSKATIVYDATKSEPCNYLIQLNKGELLEPRIFTKEELKKNNQQVWVKFARQRRVGRCINIQPVEIIKIKKREN